VSRYKHARIIEHGPEAVNSLFPRFPVVPFCQSSKAGTDDPPSLRRYSFAASLHSSEQ
jgi:hypothetical protein